MKMPQIHWMEQIGITKNPFRDTIDPDLFYRTQQHEEVLTKICLGIEDCHATILLTGASGTGKTMLSQVALRSLDRVRFEPAFVLVYPGMGKGNLLGAILKELAADHIPRQTADKLALVQDKALDLHGKGKRLVVIIDEAHFLKADALHILRSLSNLETELEKLITVLLIGEESLRSRLNRPSYASIKGRIVFSLKLAPLSLADTVQYVKYRLLKCNLPVHTVEKEALNIVHQCTTGIPRAINRIMYLGLLESAATNGVMITPAIVQMVSQTAGINHGGNYAVTP